MVVCTSTSDCQCTHLVGWTPNAACGCPSLSGLPTSVHRVFLLICALSYGDDFGLMPRFFSVLRFLLVCVCIGA
eukprot:5484734-Amphidinium_carterae.2